MAEMSDAQKQLQTFWIFGKMLEEKQKKTEKKALYFLELLLEVQETKKGLVEAEKKNGTVNPEKNVENYIRDLVTIIPEDVFFTDQDFFLSLFLAVGNAIQQDDKNWKTVFIEHLVEIFPEPMALRLAAHTQRKIIEREIERQKLGKTKEEANYKLLEACKEHHERRRQFFLSLGHSYKPSIPAEPPVVRGTQTTMVPCPNCGTEKRCDKNTKRFRCKACGFDQPYPFAPAS